MIASLVFASNAGEPRHPAWWLNLLTDPHATVQRGSGYPQIDQAALDILRLASPFEPFPRRLARDYTTLRFAYQWEFVNGALAPGTVTTGTNVPRGP